MFYNKQRKSQEEKKKKRFSKLQVEHVSIPKPENRK